MDRRTVECRVLLVEDNPGDADLVRGVLGDMAHLEHVTHLADAEREASHQAPAAVVLDLSLPDAAGLEALERLRPLIPNIPIIVLTSREDGELVVRAAREGADDYLHKREIAVLPRALAYALARRRRAEDSPECPAVRAQTACPWSLPAPASAGEGEAEAAASSARYGVLLVEDNPADADLVRTALDAVAEVTHVERLADAACELEARTPSVILLDLGLPDAVGMEGLERLRPLAPDTPIVVLTGSGSDSGLGTAAMQHGAEDYLPKSEISILPRVASYAIERRKSRARETRLALADLARRDAEAANRAKDRFLALLSHELRNPLAAIRFAIELMDRGAGRPHVVAETREVLKRQVKQLVHLVDDLFDVARISRNKLTVRLEPVPLATILHNALEAADATIAEHGHRLCVRGVAETVMVKADAGRLTQVLSNLLHNAAKFTPRGGQQDIHVEVTTEADWVVITVRDPGLGFDERQASRLFDMFYQEDDAPRGPGLGIGLALSKLLVEMHDGEIRAHSAGRGCGAEFSVRLPAIISRVQPARAAASVPTPASAPGASGLRVLIVDDNVDSATLLQALVADLGHATRVAYDGPTALPAAAELAPHVAFLDIGLPGMDGYELAQRLRASDGGARMHLVALTGWGETEDKRRALSAGFNSHITKPAEPAALTEILEAQRKALGETFLARTR
jgi:signal transduction histidine kinase